MGPFALISRGDTIPVFAFALKDSSRYSVFDLSDKLRENGWQVPAYTMPPKVEDLAVLRIVVREGFSRDLAEMFLADLAKVVEHFESKSGHKAKEPTPQFTH
jgi:glutamate decarboxylase